MLIYKLTNSVNHKFYIGKTTKSTKERFNIHIRKSKQGINTYICKAIRKYGYEHFSIEIIDDSATDSSILCLLEQKYIALLKPHYNMTKGGEGGDTSKSPNYKLGMSKRNFKGSNNPNYGKCGHLSPNFGKLYGTNPKISVAKRQAVMANGQRFNSIGEAEQTLKIKWSYSSKTKPDLFYKLTS